MLFLALLGLVIFGPKKLLALAQDAGKILARLKKVSGDFQSQLQAEISSLQTGHSAKPSPLATSSDK